MNISPLGELASDTPPTNAERYAQYILKRGTVPFYRVWTKGNATRLSLQGAQAPLPAVESSRVLLRMIK